jgi:hypothetical protein
VVVRRPNYQAKADRSTGKNDTLSSNNPRRKDPRLPSREGSISTPGNSRCHVLSARATRCGQVREVLVGNRTGYPAAQTGSRMVDSRAGLQERLSYLEAHRNRIFTLRLEWLRVRSRSKRLRRSQRFLGDAGPRGAHHFQGVEGRALRDLGLPPRAKWTTPPTPRGQPSAC